MTQPIFFSLIIPTYNRAHFIEKTLKSALKQNYTNFEIIVVDDGSTDDTQAVVEKMASPCIRYYKKENGERAKARNFGILKAQGDYITFLDSDDLLYENHFEEAAKIIQTKAPDFFHLAYEIKNPDGSILIRQNKRKGKLNNQLISGNHLSCIGVFVKKDILRIHQFNEDLAITGSEDWELWMRLASRYTLHYNNTISACMINHDNRSVLSVKADQLIHRIELSLEYLLKDDLFKRFYGKKIKQIKAHRYLYIALHLALGKIKKRSLAYLIKAIKSYPGVLFTKKTVSVLRHIVF